MDYFCCPVLDQNVSKLCPDNPDRASKTIELPRPLRWPWSPAVLDFALSARESFAPPPPERLKLLDPPLYRRTYVYVSLLFSIRLKPHAVHLLCPILPMGSFTCTSGSDIGSQCTYHCQSNYGLTGGTSTRTCTQSGNNAIWTGSEPTCIRE